MFTLGSTLVFSLQAVLEYFLYTPQELRPLLTLEEKELVPEGQAGKGGKCSSPGSVQAWGQHLQREELVKSRGL